MVKGAYRFAVVGYGKVGRVITKALLEAGETVVAVVTRRDVGAIIGVGEVISSATDLPPAANFVILSLRDREIGAVAECLPTRASIAPPPIVVHTAGAVSAKILSPAKSRGWSVAAFHPMQTFTGNEEAELLRGIAFGIDGDAFAVEACEALAARLGGFPLRVDPRRRAEYHLAAVFACNLMAGLVGESVELMTDAGISRADAMRALAPLLTRTAENIVAQGLPDAITGPLRRGDRETVARHLAALKDRPDAAEAYRALSRIILKMLDGDTNIL